jgi:predicted NUDIX family phosphoesterase
MTGDELVLVVPRSAIMADPGWYGVSTDGLDAFAALVAREGRYVPRSLAEHDRSLKQVIPYLVLRDDDAYFLMRRTRAGGDARLHDRWSIGVGGHLNPEDGDLASGLLREWHEELIADFVPNFELVGLLNDDTTDVGSVHLGAVYAGNANGRRVAIRETAKLEGRFAGVDETARVRDAMESWSRLVFDRLEGVPRS